MEPRLLIAYGLITLLLVAGAIGFWYIWTAQSRGRRREENRELARRSRRATRAVEAGAD